MTTTQQRLDPGLRLCTAVPEDADAIAALFDAAALDAVDFRHRETERVRAFWSRRQRAGDRLAVKVVAAAGAPNGGDSPTLVGAALLPLPQGRTMALVAVHPAWRGRGIGSALAGWLEDEVAAVCRSPHAETVTLVQRVLASDRDAAALLRARGWQRSRSLLRMERALTGGEADSVPAGTIEVRPVVAEREMEALLLAEYLAFRESERYDPADFARALARRRQWLATDPRFDPTVWFVAFADDEGLIAGVCLCTLQTVEREDMAWINRLAVRVPWRRRGIGQALLANAFAELARRGKRHVGLYVVADNEAAVRVYRQAGMDAVPEMQFDEYEFRACEEGGSV